MCACLSLRVTACVQESWEARRQHQILQLELRGGCEQPRGCLGLNLSPLCSELLSRLSSPMLGILMLPLFLS